MICALAAAVMVVLPACAPLVSQGATAKAAGATRPDAPPQPVATARLAQLLEANRWTLESAIDGEKRRMDVAPVGGPPYVFSFAESRLVVRGRCNQLSGTYRIDAEGQLAVSRMASTMKACDQPLMDADAAMSALLAKRWRIQAVDGRYPQLRLTSPSNDVLMLAGRATPEARFGAPTIVFLEVAPRRVACKNPVTQEKTCLEVRERKFDARGLAVGTPGPWQPLYQRIVGFTFTEGVRSVLRIKRYERGPGHAPLSSPVYMLDLVVESETVKP